MAMQCPSGTTTTTAPTTSTTTILVYLLEYSTTATTTATATTGCTGAITTRPHITLCLKTGVITYFGSGALVPSAVSVYPLCWRVCGKQQCSAKGWACGVVPTLKASEAASSIFGYSIYMYVINSTIPHNDLWNVCARSSRDATVIDQNKC